MLVILWVTLGLIVESSSCYAQSESIDLNESELEKVAQLQQLAVEKTRAGKYDLALQLIDEAIEIRIEPNSLFLKARIATKREETR